MCLPIRLPLTLVLYCSPPLMVGLHLPPVLGEEQKAQVTTLEDEKEKGQLGFCALVTLELPSVVPYVRAWGSTDYDGWGVRLKWEGKTALLVGMSVYGNQQVEHDCARFQKLGSHWDSRRLLGSGKTVRLALLPGKYKFWFVIENTRGGSIGSPSVELELKAGHVKVSAPSR